MYKLGFCPNGPDCRYRHVKLPGPFPPIEESLQKIQLRVASGNGAYPSQRHGSNGFQEEAPPWQPGPSSRTEGGAAIAGEHAQNAQQTQVQAPEIQEQEQEQQQQQRQLPPPPPPPPLPPQQRSQRRPPQQTVPEQNQAESPSQQPVANGPPSLTLSFVSASSPLPQGFTRYFIVKSSNRENLELSVMRGMWATHRNNEAKLNDAFDSCDNVILVFSVNETRHFQGCARMMSKIGVIVGGGGWKYAHGTAHYGRNFRLKWLKLCELSFNKTRHLRNPYNDNLPVKISRDCQELEPSVGNQLACLLYMEPDSDLMKVANEVALKWEEEKARGTSSSLEPDDTNIIPFEDIEEDQEEESDDDDSSSQTASQSRGRSSIGRGSRGSLGLPGRGNRGTRRNITGDAFALGYDRFAPGSADGFNVPGSVPGRGFPPYHAIPRYGGPDFSTVRSGAGMAFGHMDGPVHAPGMVFPSRPPPNGMFPHNGPGLMGPPGTPLMAGVGPVNIMAASRPHFMGGPGTGRLSRPGGTPFRPPQTASRGRRGLVDQQRRRRTERNVGSERLLSGGEPRNMGKPHKQLPASGETPGQGEVDLHGPVQPEQRQVGGFASKSFAKDDDDSSSEDEAPRRSRYGESKKRRRDWQGEEAPVGTAWDQQNQWVGTDPLEVAY